MSALLAFAEGQASQDAERQYSVVFFSKEKMLFLPAERDALRRASFRWDVFGFLFSFRAFVHCESSTGLVAESDPKPTSLPSNHAKRTDKHSHRRLGKPSKARWVGVPRYNPKGQPRTVALLFCQRADSFSALPFHFGGADFYCQKKNSRWS